MEKFLKSKSFKTDHPLKAFIACILSGPIVLVLGYPLVQILHALIKKQNTLPKTEVLFSLGWISLLGLGIYFISIIFQLNHKRVIDYLYQKDWSSKKTEFGKRIYKKFKNFIS